MDNCVAPHLQSRSFLVQLSVGEVISTRYGHE